MYFREWFSRVTEHVVLFIDVIALLIVIIAVVEAAIGAVRVMLSRSDPHLRRDVWLRFARWLVAALTFQLAADIIETSITDDWMSLGRIAVVALIRTVLNYFLERDLRETREVQRASEERAAAAGAERP
jgi:uncharacterized membrane protein